MSRTRVTIVAGFLGAGKTSVIRHLLTQQDYQGSTAVLVNEIGSVGIDGDLITEVGGEGIVVREMAGACICCTAQMPFRMAVVELLRRKPDRLIVEPTGVAAVDSVREVFADPGIAPAIDLDPVLVIIDPRHWDEPRVREHPLYREQREAADVLALSHMDLCDDDLLDRFQEAHAGIPLLVAHHGVLNAGWAQLNPAPLAREEGEALPMPSAKGIKQETLIWPDGHTIAIQELRHRWRQLAPPPSVLRCKGIIHGTDGWLAVQANGLDLQESPAHESDRSRLVIVMLDDSEAEQWWLQAESDLKELGHLSNSMT